QDVRAIHRIEAMSAVVTIGPARPLHAQRMKGEALAVARLYRIALRILDREVAKGHVVGAHQEAFAAAALTGEGEHRAVEARAAHGDAVDIERETLRQIIAPGGDGDGVAGARAAHGRL